VFFVYRERKGTENLRNTSFRELQELKPNASDYIFVSNRQVNFGVRRLRRWTPGREIKLE